MLSLQNTITIARTYFGSSDTLPGLFDSGVILAHGLVLPGLEFLAVLALLWWPNLVRTDLWVIVVNNLEILVVICNTQLCHQIKLHFCSKMQK